jgi:hypothetical protein
MNKRKLILLLMQLPLVLIVVASFFGSIYAVVKNIGGVGLAVPIILGIFIALYFYGRYLENKFREDFGLN